MSKRISTADLLAFRRTVSQWMGAFQDPPTEGQDDLTDRLCEETYDAAQPILTRRSRSWEDVIEIAEVVRSLVDDDYRARVYGRRPRTFHSELNEPLAAVHGEEAVQASLLRAVLLMAERSGSEWADPPAVSRETEISRLAARVAKLRSEYETIDRTESASREIDEAENRPPAQVPVVATGMNRTLFLKGMLRDLHERTLAIERYMTLLEPENLDDTLTLAVLLSSHVDSYMDDYPRGAPSRSCEDSTGVAKANYREERKRIERLAQKIVRGLMRVATSPLDLHVRSAAYSFDEQFNMALEEAKRLGVEASNV